MAKRPLSTHQNLTVQHTHYQPTLALPRRYSFRQKVTNPALDTYPEKLISFTLSGRNYSLEKEKPASTILPRLCLQTLHKT